MMDYWDGEEVLLECVFVEGRDKEVVGVIGFGFGCGCT